MSTDVSDMVLEEVGSRGETLTINDLLELIERHDTGPGVPDERLDSYFDALSGMGFDEKTLRDGLDTQLTDADQHPTARVQLTPEGAEQLGIDPESDGVDVKTGTDRTKDPRIDE